jgi:hypothetical protein
MKKSGAREIKMSSKKWSTRFAEFLARASKMMLYQPFYDAAVPVIRQTLENFISGRKSPEYELWKDRICSVNLILDLEPDIRRKYARLLVFLYRQGLDDDLKNVQRFLSAVLDTDGEEEAEKIIRHLAESIGDNGTDSDFLDALQFLAAHRIIGQPELTEKVAAAESKGEARELARLTESVDALTEWFKTDLKRRQEARRTRKKSSPKKSM